MSCLGAGYLPVPPRVWSRVQNSCSLDESKDNHAFAQAEATQMKNKGNVLQYKKQQLQPNKTTTIRKDSAWSMDESPHYVGVPSPKPYLTQTPNC